MVKGGAAFLVFNILLVIASVTFLAIIRGYI